MPRIPSVTRRGNGLVFRLVERMSRKRFGEVPEPMTVAAHNRAVLRAQLAAEFMAEKVRGKVPVSVGELAVYRVAVQLGCTWCIDFGAMLQKHHGLDVDRLKAIDDYATSPLFDERERLALAYADAMTASPVTVTDEQVSALERAFGREGVLELTFHISLENMRARFNSALDITDQGFTTGDACRVPFAPEIGGQSR